MKPAHPGQYRGPCKRGIFALSSWKVPLNRPECLREIKTESNDWRCSQKLMLKYKYDGNASSPLGKELSVRQKEAVEFVTRHDEHWIRVRNELGEEGFIPDSYVMASPDSVKGLPWLDNTSDDKKVQQESAEFKPYKSAYAPKTNESTLSEDAEFKPYKSAYTPKTNESTTSEDDKSQYYCRLCDKQLNGPIPYSAHNNSKAHKDEVEVQSSYNN